MQIDKQAVIDLLRSRGDSTQADQAQQQLPDQLDHEQHADLLSKFGVDPSQLLAQLPGGVSDKLGGLLGKEL